MTVTQAWKILRVGDRFHVKHSGKTVAELDSLAIIKALGEDDFFLSFTRTFTAQRQAEIAELLKMKTELSGDPERLKILDNLIADNLRAEIKGA